LLRTDLLPINDGHQNLVACNGDRHCRPHLRSFGKNTARGKTRCPAVAKDQIPDLSAIFAKNSGSGDFTTISVERERNLAIPQNGGFHMTAKARPEEAWSSLLMARWEQVSRKVMELAQAFPEKELESRPLAAVRTFGEVLRHIAFWNLYVADSLRGKAANDTANELPLADYSTKAKILDELKRSSEDVAVALRERPGSPDLKIAELIVTFVEHTSEHYGQLVVYARLIGIVPPTSRA
jgi:uncharacterized damage-inducible protein DinB